MALQLAVSTRNAILDAIEADWGTSVVVKIRTGAKPANCAAADAGTVLASITCPADYFASAASGSKAKSGTWLDASADASGTAGHFRVYKSDGTTCVAQGSVSLSGGGGDMILTAVVLNATDPFQINTFTLAAGNA